LAESLSQRLKQSFFVENRTGANGMIASENVASSPADGYTLLLASDGPIVIMPLLKPGGDVSKRLIPVNLTAESSFVLMARPDLNVKTLSDVVALAKKEKLTFGSAGVGSQHHLAGELLKSRAGIDLIHVPYKGSAEAMGDLVGKRIDLLFGGVPPSLPFITANQVRAIAVTSDVRSRKLPEVPRCRPSTSRDSRATRSRSGPGSWRPPERRRLSSTSWMRRSAMRSRLPRSSRALRRPAWTA
jgi:tripartite-type tricarboxylate transporter receptor subunit TctC